MAVKKRKKAKPAKAAKAKKKAVKRAKASKRPKKAVKAKAVKKAPMKAKAKARTKTKRKTAGPGVVKTVTKAAQKLVAAAKRAVAPAPNKDVIGEGNYTAARNFRKRETSFIDNNRDTIARKAKEAEAAIDGPEGAELEQAREETAARGQE